MKYHPLDEKVKTYWLGSAKSFWHSSFAHFAEAGKRHSKV
jgi:hypothetical protein